MKISRIFEKGQSYTHRIHEVNNKLPLCKIRRKREKEKSLWEAKNRKKRAVQAENRGKEKPAGFKLQLTSTELMSAGKRWQSKRQKKQPGQKAPGKESEYNGTKVVPETPAEETAATIVILNITGAAT